jgi:hypothetical protein
VVDTEVDMPEETEEVGPRHLVVAVFIRGSETNACRNLRAKR